MNESDTHITQNPHFLQSLLHFTGNEIRRRWIAADSPRIRDASIFA